MKAAAMAWMAGREDWQARCLREKRARKRRASGSDSLVRVLRRVRIVGSSTGGGDVAEGAILLLFLFRRGWQKVRAAKVTAISKVLSI